VLLEQNYCFSGLTETAKSPAKNYFLNHDISERVKHQSFKTIRATQSESFVPLRQETQFNLLVTDNYELWRKIYVMF
jgi:hypothetical protein